MSEILVSLSGAGTYSLDLSIVQSSDDDSDIEVWRAIFTDQNDNDKWEVYFEMGPDYEIWDLIDEAISTYRGTIEELD